PLDARLLAEARSQALESGPKMDEISEVLAREEATYYRGHLSSFMRARGVLITYLAAVSVLMIPVTVFLGRIRRFNVELETKVKGRTGELQVTNESLQREIGERRQVEEALSKREQEFRALAENSPDVIGRFDRDCRLVYANPALEKLLGIPEQTLFGKKFSDILPESGGTLSFQEKVREVMETGFPVEAEIILGNLRTGYSVCQHVRFVPEWDRSGQVVSALTIGRDITALKEAEGKLRTVVENFPDFIVRFDREYRFHYVNPAVAKAFGLQLVGKTHRDLNLPGEDPAQRERLENGVKQAFQQGVPNTLEAKWPTVWGERVFEVRHVPELDESGKVVSVLGITRDITERKQHEEMLRERAALQSRLIKIANVAPVAVAEFRLAPDGKTSMPYCTRAVKDIFGMDPKELVEDFSPAWAVFHPQDLPFVRGAIEESARTMEPFHCEWRVRNPAKGEIWVDCRSIPEREPDGSIVWYGYFHDISERKEHEEMLRERVELQSRLTKITNVAPVAIFEFRLAPDGKMSMPYCTRAFTDVYGLDPKELAEDFSPAWALNHPEDAPRLRGAIEESARTLEPFHHEWRVRHPTKGEIWADCRSIPQRGPDGSIVWYGYFHDISERKQGEKRLRNSEARYRALYRENPSMIFTLDAEGKVLSVNQTGVDQLGYSMGELEGESVLKVFHPDDRRAVAEQFQVCLHNPNQVHHWQFRKIRKDGAVAWVDELAQAITDLGGALNVLVVCQDVTERKRAEEEIRALNAGLERRVKARTKELAESEKRFRTIYDMAPVSIWEEDWTEVIESIHDLQTQGVSDFPTYFGEHPEFVARALKAVKVLDVNQWSLGMFAARDKAEMLASLGPVFATPDTLPGFVGELTALAQGQTVYHTEMNLNTVKGDTLHGLLAMSFPPRGSGLGDVLVSVLDITERQRAETQIQHLNKQLKARAQALAEANKELESFSHSASHDLRAPLRIISGFSHLLLEDYGDKLGAEGKDSLQTVIGASERMGELIDDLLQLSRITRSELRRAPVDLSALARSVADELRKANPERSVELFVEPGLIAQADAHLMRIVLENLLGNAWKFTSQKPAARIEFRRATREGAPVYFVCDNGAGFDMAYANKLFGAFQRLHSTADFPGTGVGLATVQRVIHRHGGQVWAEGEIGRGATFYFTLPNGLKAL
ncbi:MAG: multi-sensor signal transduction histidine kinase, partial [Pedosphaera sp.]|nr:multi-sensor signal transduction histidine kinase [Pedosphaera sp.]